MGRNKEDNDESSGLFGNEEETQEYSGLFNNGEYTISLNENDENIEETEK